MRRRIGLIAVAACLAGCGSATVTHSQSAGSCVGPQLTLSNDVASPGSTVSAAGEWFATDCNDTGQASTPPPLTGLNVVVVQGGKTWRVASKVNAASDHYSFHVPVVLPSDLQPGPAMVRVDGYGPAVKLLIAE